MVNIEQLTPDGWKPSASEADIHSAVTYAKALCMEEPSTYRVLRNSDLICLVRQQGIIWINASSEVMGETQIEETVSAR
jgi:hypothetical protein